MFDSLLFFFFPSKHVTVDTPRLFVFGSASGHVTFKYGSMVDYSKWKDIEVSDDEDDTHPNIDTPSLFRWRHQARVEKMKETDDEKKKVEAEKKALKQKMFELKKKERDEDLAKELERLRKKDEELKKKEEEIEKKERLAPWNVDTISKDGFSRSIVNKPPPKKELTEEEKHQQLVNFMDNHEKDVKKFGMLSSYDDSREYLRDRPHLVTEETASYLTMWCVTLQTEEKTALMERVAHQAIVMQYILELAKQLQMDPRSCVNGFFQRMKTAEKQYTDAFVDELDSFKDRVRARAKIRVQEAMKKVEEEERQKRLGPGGLDPLEVIETLPTELKECFETQNVPMLKKVLANMSKEDAAYHMKRCVDSGLWVADAKAAGLTPASEQFDKDDQEEEDDGSSDEHYENIEEGGGDLGLD